MNENDEKLVVVKESGGVSILGIITLVLLIGKVFFDLNLSWWGVFAPLWLPPVIVLVGLVGILGLCVLAVACLVIYEAYQEYKKNKEHQATADKIDEMAEELEKKVWDAEDGNDET